MVLGTLSVFGVLLVTLHGLALGRATVTLRREVLRLAADEVARDPTGAHVPGSFRVVLVDGDGRALRGAAEPWMRRELAHSAGEYCEVGVRPCFALRDVQVGGRPATAVVYYRASSLYAAPLTVAFLASLLLWLAVSAVAGLVLLKALDRAAAARQWLVAGLAHDLATPLTSIRGFAETLLGETPDDSPSRRGLTLVFREALRMQRLLDDMLAFSRLEARKLSLVRRTFDLRELVRTAAERAQLAHGIVPRLELPGAEAFVDADRDRLDQVMANLVDNAFRYGGPEVEIALRPDGEGWRLEVRDHGPGLSTEERRRAFEPFERGDRGAGSGLGLAIARELVERHGGRLDLEEAPGGGCLAVLRLPAGRGRNV